MKYSRFYSFSFALALSCMIGFSAFADDLEIYIGDGNEAVSYQPNVLFVMDTSGSMRSQDGTGESRLLRVQDALRQLMQTATNINVGLMRFSNVGGPVLYPVKPIDSPATADFVIPVNDSNDDVHKIDAIATNRTNNQLVLTQGTSTVKTGLRFTDLSIPRGAVITSAALRFTSATPNSAPSEFTIRAEAVGNAASFEAVNDDVDARVLTAASTDWNDDSNIFPLVGESVISPDLSHVIQEVVDRADWCGGNALNLIIDGTSPNAASGRQAYSRDDGTTRAPQLLIKYDDSTATGCIRKRRVFQINSNRNNAEEKPNGRQSTGSGLTMIDSSNAYIGLRFENIDLPQGASVLDAYLEFSGKEAQTSPGANMIIRGVAEDSPKNFKSYPRYLLRDKPKTSASVSWNGIEPWYLNGEYRSPSVKGIVEEIVNRPGWKINNEMMFVLSDFTDIEREAHSHNGKRSGAPRFIIEYEGNATPGVSVTARDSIVSSVNELTANGSTPIVDTLYEGALYYGGLPVDYGLRRGNDTVSSTVRRLTRVSNRSSYIGEDSLLPVGCDPSNLNDSDCISEYIPAGATYISPIEDVECQVNNHIVLLSDGQPNGNKSVSKVQNMIGRNCSGSGSGKCGPELTEFLSEANDATGASVKTHTIGFAANDDVNNYLNQLASKGGGEFYRADDSESLLQVFNTILTNIKDDNATFVAPGVAVNQQNRLTHLDQLYFALFKPSESAFWPGNLKRYRLSNSAIVDVTGIDAVDPNTGFFANTARSYWSPQVDGGDVEVGGALSQLTLSRSVYAFDDSPGAIFSSSNRLVETNDDITISDLNLDAFANKEAIRTELLKWSRGVDVFDVDGDMQTTDINLMIGDPIHSQPVVVNYGTNDDVVIVATNHGFLHSFDTDDGTENFAIIPKDLLGNLYKFYENANTQEHTYGMDGDLVVRYHDDKVWLYAGMRRGGNNYYVIDITQKLNPKFLFKIDGSSNDFSNLGQSWSKPILTKIKIGGSEKDVMIFAGGYDPDQDNKSDRTVDSEGNSVFIVDADTGELLWSASNEDADLNIPEMKYSIPARVAVIDRDYDGLVDHMYVADMGAQIFRLDIYNGNSRAELVKGKLMATLGADDPENNRRFYYAPDVSQISLGDEQYYAVAIGSGFRAGPLNNTVQDKFYMFKDTGVFMRDEEGEFMFPEAPFTEADLYDATLHELTSADDNARQIANTDFASKNGWMIRLDTRGEKVLSSPLIFDFKIFFTTYLPASASESTCAPPTGFSRAYLVDLFNANSVTDMNNNGTDEHLDRYADLQQAGIAPDAKILIENIVKPVVCVGVECASAVIEVDNQGNQQACGSAFECLAENIYGRFERVKKDAWSTEVEDN